MTFQLPFSRNALVAQSEPLELAQLLRANILWSRFSNRHLRQRDLANLMQEPRVHGGEPRHLAHAHAAFEGVSNIAQPLRPRSYQHLRQPPRLQNLRTRFLACLQRAPGFHQGFFEGAANGHHLAYRLHLRPKRLIGAGKLFKLPLGNFHDDVINRRLEAGRRLARNVVGNFVERVAHGQLGGDLGDGKARCLRGQRRRARDARIHLDHRHASVDWVDGKLHVGAACLHADLAHYGDGRIAHLLILAVGERLRRGHGNRVTRVHAHGVEIFNGTDNDDVVGEVAHDLKLVFLPAEHALFDEALMNG